MSTKVIVELRDDATLYDATGLTLVSPPPHTKYFEETTLPHNEINPDLVLSLIKQGVTVDEIIKLKNQDLI